MTDPIDLVKKHFNHISDYYGAIAMGHERWAQDTQCTIEEAREWVERACDLARKELQKGEK